MGAAVKYLAGGIRGICHARRRYAPTRNELGRFSAELAPGPADSMCIKRFPRQTTMRQQYQTLQYFAAVQRLRARGDAIEWEELPSLADSLAERLVNDASRRHDEPSGHGSAWDNTMPSDLLSLVPTEPFRETLDGLATREVNEPDVFRHFFGARTSNT
jgi:hypothetical protein